MEGVLKDVALDASIDERGRLVATTNTRRIANNLGLSPTTVHKHLSKLRQFGSYCMRKFATSGPVATRNAATSLLRPPASSDSRRLSPGYEATAGGKGDLETRARRPSHTQTWRLFRPTQARPDHRLHSGYGRSLTASAGLRPRSPAAASLGRAGWGPSKHSPAAAQATIG